MTALPLSLPDPERPGRREAPQPQDPSRAPLCPACWHLEDAVGHVWACLNRNGRQR